MPPLEGVSFVSSKVFIVPPLKESYSVLSSFHSASVSGVILSLYYYSCLPLPGERPLFVLPL